MALRWGIVSSGKISHDFVSALASLPETDHQIVAVGARSGSNAKVFAELHNIPRGYEGYTKIAEDPDIDIVYVGNLNPQHFEVSKLMLEHGKHVLCEKPLTLNEKQTRQLVELARSKKLLLLDGVWSRSFPAYAELRKLLDSGLVGDVVQLHITFGFNLEGIDRLKSKKMGGGTILDLGVYVLQFQQFIFKSEEPLKVVSIGGLNSEGTDDYTNSIWSYPGDKVACLSTSAKTLLPNEAIIVGTKGMIRVPEFWCPTKLITPSKTYEFELPPSSKTFNFRKSVGLSYEAAEARRCIRSGQIESPNITHVESIQLARHMDLLRQQIGVVFSEDQY